MHEFIDTEYGSDGDDVLRQRIQDGADVNAVEPSSMETPLHVATRRRRLGATTILLDAGANIDAVNGGGKTAYAHAARRKFSELETLLLQRGADDSLNAADQLAVAVVNGRLDDARRMLSENPDIVRTGNPEEDRLLADVAGRSDTEPIKLLIDAGADLTATALDFGTPLHQAAWFGQPANARLLVDAGAPLNCFDATHNYSPLGWAVHGAKYSGDSSSRIAEYVALVELLLSAGSQLHYADQPDSDAYYSRLLGDAVPEIAERLENAR